MGLARLADVGWGNEGRVFTSGFPRAAPLRAGGSRRDMRAIPQQLITVLGPRPAFPSHPGRQRCADADVVPSVHDSSFVQRRCRQMLDARYLYATSPPPSNPHARLSHHHCAAHGQSVGSQSANNAHGQQSSGGTITRAWCCRSPPPVLKRGREEGARGQMWRRQWGRLTRDQILVQAIHSRHVSLVNRKPPDLRVLPDPLLPHALWQRHIAVLQAPPHQQLAGRTGILFGQGHNGRVLHAQGADQRRICLDNNAMLLAKGSDVGPRVERMHFDLIDRGRNSWFRV